MDKKVNKESQIEPWEMAEPRQKPADATVNENELKKIARKTYRGPVTDGDSARVEIDNKVFSLIDMGSHGIGIDIPHPDHFSVGSVYALKLLLGSDSFSMQGKITHITTDEENHHHCGIELTDLSPEAEHKLQQFLQQKRASLFVTK